MELFGLFVSALVAATLIPAQSELVLAALVAQGHYDYGLLVLIATSGNVLGACVNWWLGRFIGRYRHIRWLSLSEQKLATARDIYQRWGVWSLLFAWLPFVGDPLTLIAGVLRTPLWWFVILVTIGKLARYSVIAVLI